PSSSAYVRTILSTREPYDFISMKQEIS
ncbi:unnamed protein product, partial [Rotaria socialis]